MLEPEDIVSVSELQTRLKAVLDQTRRTQRPVLVTQRGRPAGVLMNIDEYQRLADRVERAELEEDIARGERAIAEGDLHEWADVKRERLLHLLDGEGE